MKTQRSLLMYLLASLLACSIISGPAFADGPWDIDNGDGSETNGGGFGNGTPTIGDSEIANLDPGGDGEPNLTVVVDFFLWHYFGYLAQKAEVEVITYRDTKHQRRNASGPIMRQ